MQVKVNSHVFLSGTGGLSLLHGLVGSHPQLALSPLPSPRLLLLSSHPPHPPASPQKLLFLSLLSLQRMEVACVRGGERWLSLLCCSAEDERILFASGAKHRMIKGSSLYAQHPPPICSSTDIPASHLVVKQLKPEGIKSPRTKKSRRA